MTRFKTPEITKGLNLIVGGYGSGKSEVAVNFARYIVLNRPDETDPVAIVDLDIINPYFRSREASQVLEELGIEAVNPKGAQFHADLPIILPQIKGIIGSHNGYAVLDVGGDDVGARVLSSFAEAFQPDSYQMNLVLNANRPFTSDVDSTMKMIQSIERSSRLKFTGLIGNTHLMDDTTVDTIMDGLKLTREVSQVSGLPIKFISVLDSIADKLDNKKIDVPLLLLHRLLLKPWEL